MRRGEIYLADLNKQIGSEQSGLRPVVIIQNEVGNAFSPTTIICPITSKNTTKYSPTHVSITPNNCDIIKTSIILCEQIRVIDKTRLVKKLGKIKNMDILNEINKKLLVSIGVS